MLSPLLPSKTYCCGNAAGLSTESRSVSSPSLYNIFGSTAGTITDYDSSDAMVESGIVWDAKTMDAYIADSKGYVPSTRMNFRGIDDEQDRLDLIAYLMQATQEWEHHARNKG